MDQFVNCRVKLNGRSSTQALEKEVSDHLKARSVMSDKLKNKQKEVQKALKTLDKEVKHR